MTDLEVGTSQSGTLPLETNVIKANGINSELGLSLLRNAKGVEVKVGRGKAAITWYLPKDLLIHHSTFFREALESNLQEANTLKITLPNYNSNTFELFVQWLFIGHFQVKSRGLADEANELVQAWHLGHGIGCSTFQDNSMRLLLQQHFQRLLADPEFIGVNYNWIPEDSKLRQLLVASFLHVSMNDRYAIRKPILPEDRDGLEDFAIDVMKEVFAKGHAGFRIPSSDSAMFLLRPTSKDTGYIDFRVIDYS